MEYLNAFLCGGILCAVGQIIIDKTQLTPARILTGYVVVGVLLSALGLYEPLAQWGGAGATVPLTGFGHTLAKGVREAVASDGWIGIFTGGLTAAAGGVTAAVVAGVLMAAHLPAGGQAVREPGPPRHSCPQAHQILGSAASCARPKPLPAPSVQDLSVSYGGQVLQRWVCSSKKSGCATFLRSQGNRCRPVLILSFFCCSFLSGFLLYYGHRQKSTERNIRSCSRFTALLLAALMLLSLAACGRSLRWRLRSKCRRRSQDSGRGGPGVAGAGTL